MILLGRQNPTTCPDFFRESHQDREGKMLRIFIINQIVFFKLKIHGFCPLRSIAWLMHFATIPCQLLLFYVENVVIQQFFYITFDEVIGASIKLNIRGGCKKSHQLFNQKNKSFFSLPLIILFLFFP